MLVVKAIQNRIVGGAWAIRLKIAASFVAQHNIEAKKELEFFKFCELSV